MVVPAPCRCHHAAPVPCVGLLAAGREPRLGADPELGPQGAVSQPRHFPRVSGRFLLAAPSSAPRVFLQALPSPRSPGTWEPPLPGKEQGVPEPTRATSQARR